MGYSGYSTRAGYLGLAGSGIPTAEQDRLMMSPEWPVNVRIGVLFCNPIQPNPFVPVSN